jgi:steroid delta-isomerase-like uncharacterized protein
MSVTERSSEQVVRDCFAWLNGDDSKTDAVAESVHVSGPIEDDTHTREEWQANIDAARAGFPDLHYEVTELVAGDEIVFAEYVLSGTHESSFMGVPPTGRRAELPVVNKFTVNDGRVVEVEVYMDPNELTEQLGLNFPAIIGQLPKLAWGKLQSTL